jgi:hypothetical protein
VVEGVSPHNIVVFIRKKSTRGSSRSTTGPTKKALAKNNKQATARETTTRNLERSEKAPQRRFI